MMNDIGSWALAFALAGAAVAGTDAVADADGRADWRLPEPPAGEPADADGVASVGAGDATRGNAPPVLGAIGPQSLVAGRPWRLHIRVRDVDGGVPELSVRGLPDGASLDDEGGGWHRLEWTPPVGTRGEIDLSVVAVDALDRRLRSERVVRLRVRGDDGPLALVPDAASGIEEALGVNVGGGGPGSNAPALGSASGFESDREPGAGTGADVPRPIAPRLEPLASRIVSAGRTVSFRVVARLDGDPERRPSLQIDRLPRSASFDENPDGSRTFYWPTGDRDQGEHRFRITALHPDDPTLATRVDLLVIVGDPTRATTMPLGDAPSLMAAEPVPATGAPRDPRPEDGASVSDDDEPFLPQADADEPDHGVPEDDSRGEGRFHEEPIE